MVQSDPEAREGVSAGAEHQLWCVREGGTSSHLFPRGLGPKFPQTPFCVISPGSSSRRSPGQQAGTGWTFCSLNCTCPVSGLPGRSQEVFPVRFVQDSGCNSDSTPSSTPNILRNEDCRGGVAETRTFEWTKGLKATVLLPKWKKTLCQQQHVSLYEKQLSLLCLEKVALITSFVTQFKKMSRLVLTLYLHVCLMDRETVLQLR